LKYELANEIDLRIMPKLRFFWDLTPERADRIDTLLAQLREVSPKTLKLPKRLPKRMKQMDKRIKELLAQAQSVVVVSHIRPDGDAIGSLLGMGLALRHAGKQVQMVLQDGLPEKYSFLAGADQVKRKIEEPFDTLVVVDCSDLPRTGTVIAEEKQPDLVIDHHKTNLAFGRLNLIDPQAVATSAILAEKLPEWGLKIDKDVAECLLTGLVGDTIGFRTPSMTPQAMRLAANLMEKGANLPLIYQKTLLSRTVSELRYWGQGLTNIHHEDGILWTSLTLDDRINLPIQKMTTLI